MASTDYYTPSNAPVTDADLSSSVMRAEFQLIKTGFGKLPNFSGNASKAVIINASANGLSTTTGTLALAGNFATVGASALTMTVSGTTNITLPTSGTLYGTATGSITSAQLAASLSDETGSGAAVFATSPTLVTPLLGTPTSGTLTNCTGLPVSSGISGLGTGVATFLATPSSANLLAAVTDETGTGGLVFATSPTLVTPTLGAATATTINKVTFTSPATGSTLTIADGKTLTASNTLTFTGTDASSVAFGAGGTVAYTANNLSVFAATTSAQLAGVISDETGTGALVFANSPVLVTPALGTPASGVATNLTGTAAGLTAGTVTTNANLTGPITSTGNATAVAAQTGTGSTFVMQASPTLTTPNIGAATGTSLAVTAAITSSGATAGIGYATGAGGTVTQLTSKATGVTLNNVCGQITTTADALSANTRTSFTLTNSAIAATDLIHAHRVSGGTANSYRIEVDSVASGSCVIAITNITAGSLSEAVVIGFSVIKSVAA